MADTKKYYWLKLKNDFFKRHDIKIIESMPNGKDYVLFYMKLLLESVDHVGELRFSETVPYNDTMLATITDTNIDIVRSAVKVFSEFGMMEQFDDGTLYMSQVEKMLGSETSDAIRMRKSREKQKLLLESHSKREQCSKPFKNRSPEIELDKEIETELELDINTNTVENIKSSIKVSKPKKAEIELPEEAIRLATLLKDLHIQNFDSGFTTNSINSWAKDIEAINRLDKRSWNDIEDVIRYCKQKGEFWGKVTISGSKLRKNFATIIADKNAKQNTQSRIKPSRDAISGNWADESNYIWHCVITCITMLTRRNGHDYKQVCR